MKQIKIKDLKPVKLSDEDSQRVTGGASGVPGLPQLARNTQTRAQQSAALGWHYITPDGNLFE